MVYKVAVIGAGIIARSHLKAIQAMEELQAVGVADIDADKARQLSDQYGIKAYRDYREMVEQEKPNIVVITLPHFLHKEAAVWCARQGCHLMLEKPMALNNRECDEIIEAAAANRIKLMVGHTQQYLSENIHAKKIIQEGALGELVMIHDVRHSNYFSPSRPSWFFEKQKAGGGIFMNLGSHSIDKIQWFTDSRIVKVKGSVSYYGAIGDVEGSGIAFVETASGVAATICQSGYNGVERNETEFIFSNGMMKLVAGKGLWINENGEYRPSSFDRTDNHFILQFQDLLGSIDNDTEPVCSGAYGKSVVSAVEALYRSSAEGQEIRVAESD